MFRSVKSLKNMLVEATDGYLGKIEEFYFDDQSWAIRYLVVEIGPILSKKKKLLSPAAFVGPRSEGFVVNITTEQIRESPDIDTDKPISRQKELKLHDYYNWPYYWNYPIYTNAFGAPLFSGYGGAFDPAALSSDRYYIEKDREIRDQQLQQSNESGMRSTNEIIDYAVKANNTDIGYVDDFLIDDDQWVLRYSIINTDGFLSGRKVILGSHWAQKIEWASKSVFFDIEPDLIKNGPPYDKDMVLSREYETRLSDYYHRPYYWID